MIHVSDVNAWAEKRLAAHREKLEVMSTAEAASIATRARIAELKELLAALKNEKPPVWISPDE